MAPSAMINIAHDRDERHGHYNDIATGRTPPIELQWRCDRGGRDEVARCHSMAGRGDDEGR